MIELNDLNPEVVTPKKAANINENSKISRQKKETDWIIKIEHNDKTTTENTTEQPAVAVKELEIPVVDKGQTSTTNPKPFLASGFDEHLRHKLTAGYTEPSMESDEVSRFWFDNSHPP